MEIKINVLFVASGNSKNFEIAPFIKEQGESLKNKGINISYFPIVGRGIFGYLKASLLIRKYLKSNNIDLVHAHYTLSGWSVILSFVGVKKILSLMGDDAYGTYIGPGKIKKESYFLILSTLIIQPFVNFIITKSEFINSFVFLKKKSIVIPNGINLEKFFPIQKNIARKQLGLVDNKQFILFLGDCKDKRKNFPLIAYAYQKINSPNVELLSPFPVSHEKVVLFLNAADVMVMTSFMEGSPNIIKEAMACNCPIVSTRVGDVEWVIGNTEGCYLADFDPEDFAEKLLLALHFAREKGRTRGRERIIQLGLDSDTVAKKIIGVYKKVLGIEDDVDLEFHRAKGEVEGINQNP